MIKTFEFVKIEFDEKYGIGFSIEFNYYFTLQIFCNKSRDFENLKISDHNECRVSSL